MLIPSLTLGYNVEVSSLSRRVNANSQQGWGCSSRSAKLIKKGEC